MNRNNPNQNSNPNPKPLAMQLSYLLSTKNRRKLPLSKVVARLDELIETVFESATIHSDTRSVCKISDRESLADFIALLQARDIVANAERIQSKAVVDYALAAARSDTPSQN